MRTLHSQATEKSSFVFGDRAPGTHYRGGGGSLGPRWRGGTQDPVTPLPAEGQPAQSFFPAPCGPFSSDLAIGCGQMAEGNAYLSINQNAEARNMPRAEEEGLRIKAGAGGGGTCSRTPLGPAPPSHSNDQIRMPAESPRQQASIGPGSVSVRNPRLYLCPDTCPFWKKALHRSFRLYAKAVTETDLTRDSLELASRLAYGGRGVDCNLAPQQSTPRCEPRAAGRCVPLRTHS